MLPTDSLSPQQANLDKKTTFGAPPKLDSKLLPNDAPQNWKRIFYAFVEYTTTNFEAAAINEIIVNGNRSQINITLNCALTRMPFGALA
ncbi:unnamed protein product, partial [Mesorhabditis spiculigera]